MAKKQSKFMQPMRISEELAAVVGKGPMPRTEVTKKLWATSRKISSKIQKTSATFLLIARSKPSLATNQKLACSK